MSAGIFRLHEVGRQFPSLQEAFGDQEPRQRFLVYFHELLSGHPGEADAASKRVSGGLLWIEKASKHCSGAWCLSGRPRNEGVHLLESCGGVCVGSGVCV